MQIWDLHYHSVFGEHSLKHEDLMSVMDRFGIERIFALDVGRRAAQRNLWTPAETRELDDAERAVLEAWFPRVLGLLRVFPSHLEETLERMERWIGQGPCIGIKFIIEPPSSRFFDSPENFTCAHPHADPIIRKAVELGALVYVHTYLKRPNWNGQEKGAWDPRRLGTGNNRGESSPMDLVQLAERFPEVPMICGHSGSDGEITLRTIRACPNVLAEFSGHDPNSGAVDLAVKELGVKRIVWGSHVPTRCLANALSGVYEADLSQEERRLILGGNLRRLLAPALRRKGIRV